MEQNKKPILTEEQVAAKKEAEKLEILQKVNEVKGEQQLINEMGEFHTHNEIKQFVLKDTDDPDKKHEIYYKGIERLLKQVANPKKDKAMKEAFKILREEKNIFLNRGKRKNEKGIRGSDARMAYISDMEEALNIIATCILDGNSPINLYTAFRDKNIERGFYNDLNTHRRALSSATDDHLKDVIGALPKVKES